MKKYIQNINKQYDRLREPKRFFYFLLLVFPFLVATSFGNLTVSFIAVLLLGVIGTIRAFYLMHYFRD